MTITTEHQDVTPLHRWPGIVSSIIGATSITLTLLLIGMGVLRLQPPRPVVTALQVLSLLMLLANLLGLALGVSGARVRASRKLYPYIGFALNAANLTIFVVLAFAGG